MLYSVRKKDLTPQKSMEQNRLFLNRYLKSMHEYLQKTMENHHLLFETESIRIYYNFADDWIYVMWIGETSLENAKIGYEKILNILISQQCTKILSDHRKRTGIWTETINWLHTDWGPRAEAAGLKAVAIVYSKELYSKLSADELINKSKSKISRLAFNEIETAENWLRVVQV